MAYCSYFWGPAQSGGEEKNKNNVVQSIFRKFWSRNNVDQLDWLPYKMSAIDIYSVWFECPTRYGTTRTQSLYDITLEYWVFA